MLFNKQTCMQLYDFDILTVQLLWMSYIAFSQLCICACSLHLMSYHQVGYRGTCYGRTDDFDVDEPDNGVVSGFRESCEPEPSKSLNH